MADSSRPSRAALKQWFKTDGRTQALLAEAVGVTQQTISALLGSRVPSPDLADLIEVATGVEASGWLTERERTKRKKRLDRARELRASDGQH